MIENFNCVFIETIKGEVIWFLHGMLHIVNDFMLLVKIHN